MVKTVLESKREIRQAAKKVLENLPPEENAEKSIRIAERALADPACSGSERVLIYRAMPGEVQTEKIAQGLKEAGHSVFAPVVVAGKLELVVAVWGELEENWETGPYGILQPRTEGLEPLAPESLDLVFAPGLAFDTTGGRLGYGKGFFDRLFSKTANRCHRIGLAFDLQVIPEVPMGPNDKALHRLITETRAITCSS